MYRPDLNNNIVNLSNSFLKRFGVEPFHPTIKKIDDLIKDKKKILVFLFDGMGKTSLKHIFLKILSLEVTSFIQWMRHILQPLLLPLTHS